MQDLTAGEMGEVNGGLAVITVIAVTVVIDIFLIGVTVGMAQEASNRSSS